MNTNIIIYLVLSFAPVLVLFWHLRKLWKGWKSEEKVKTFYSRRFWRQLKLIGFALAIEFLQLYFLYRAGLFNC